MAAVKRTAMKTAWDPSNKDSKLLTLRRVVEQLKWLVAGFTERRPEF
jgi:hypothetical protein